jgi:hypothetical protein
MEVECGRLLVAASTPAHITLMTEITRSDLEKLGGDVACEFAEPEAFEH